MMWKKKKAIKKLSKYIAFSDYTKLTMAMTIDLFIQGKISKETLINNLNALNEFINKYSTDYIITENELNFEAYNQTQQKISKKWKKKLRNVMEQIKSSKKKEENNRDRMLI